VILDQNARSNGAVLALGTELCVCEVARAEHACVSRDAIQAVRGRGSALEGLVLPRGAGVLVGAVTVKSCRTAKGSVDLGRALGTEVTCAAGRARCTVAGAVRSCRANDGIRSLVLALVSSGARLARRCPREAVLSDLAGVGLDLGVAARRSRGTQRAAILVSKRVVAR
jgi:hypothetical protein